MDQLLTLEGLHIVYTYVQIHKHCRQQTGIYHLDS